MHITSDKGTDLYVGMLNNYRFLNMDKADGLGKGYMVNFPSYEIFTCPNFRDVNGIVYNTKPLIFNNQIVDNFMLKFEDGCVVDYNPSAGGSPINFKNFLKNSLKSAGDSHLIQNYQYVDREKT